MARGFIRLPERLRRKAEPEVYQVRCGQCSRHKLVEIGEVDADSVAVHGEEPAVERCETLPERCPECGGRLRSERIMVNIRY